MQRCDAIQWRIARLIREGLKTEYGLEEVEAAKADSRWDGAYGSGKETKIPDDLQSVIDADPPGHAQATGPGLRSPPCIGRSRGLEDLVGPDAEPL